MKNERPKLTIGAIVSVAKRFASLKDFKAAHRDLYSHLVYKKKVQSVCRKAGLSRRTPNGYWNYERVLRRAKECKTRSEFIGKHKSAYTHARSHDFLDRIYEEARLGAIYKMDWTLQECASEAKKHKTRSDFFHKSSPAYHFARRRGWLDKITKHMKPQGNYTRRKLYAFEHPDKSVYVGLTYNYERRYKHHMNTHKVLIAKKKEMGHRFVEFDVLYPAHIAAKKERELIESYLKLGWTILNINRAGSLGGNVVKWDFESCRKEARRYKSRDEFLRRCPSAVVIARRNGWMDEICKHMPYILRPKYTDDELKKLASKFSSKNEFREQQ
jgi:predicted GIY-YIG superfamily endonuclease